MIEATIHDQQGRILQTVTVLNEAELEANVPMDALWIAGLGDCRTQYVKVGEFRSYPERPGPWAVFDYTAEQWTDPRTEADLAAEAEAALAAYRATLNPFARAFFMALTFFPAEGFAHMLDAYEQQIAALPQYHPLRIWDQRIVQIIRSHPDMDTFGTSFGLTAEQLDAICAVAMQIEAGQTPTLPE